MTRVDAPPWDPLLSHDTPRAIELLDAARRQLVDELLPETQGSHRYSALMIANALSIVLAELQLSNACSEPSVRNEDASTLCRQLREGSIADLLDHDLLSRLKADVEARLAVSNPKRLDI